MTSVGGGGLTVTGEQEAKTVRGRAPREQKKTLQDVHKQGAPTEEKAAQKDAQFILGRKAEYIKSAYSSSRLTSDEEEGAK